MTKKSSATSRFGLLAVVMLAVSAAHASTTLQAGTQLDRLGSVFIKKISKDFPISPRDNCYETNVQVTKQSTLAEVAAIGLTGECVKAKLLGSVWNYEMSYYFRLSDSDLLEQQFAIVEDPAGYLVLVDLLAYKEHSSSGTRERIAASTVNEFVMSSAFRKALEASRVEAEARRFDRMREDIEKRLKEIQGRLEK